MWQGARWSRRRWISTSRPLHDGYLRGAKARGAKLLCDASLVALERSGGIWHVRTKSGAFEAGIVVNAAGAWADGVAAMAGAAPAGLVPKRRTAMILSLPEGVDAARWPMVNDVDEQFYLQAGRRPAARLPRGRDADGPA